MGELPNKLEQANRDLNNRIPVIQKIKIGKNGIGRLIIIFKLLFKYRMS